MKGALNFLSKSALVLSLVLSAGCVNFGYKRPTRDFIDSYHKPATSEIALETRKKALEHRLYDFIPFQREQMHFWDARHITWYLLGNSYNGLFGEGNAPNIPYSTNINFSSFFAYSIKRNLGANFEHYPPIGSGNFKKHINFTLLEVNDGKVDIFSLNKPNYEGKYYFKLKINDFKPYVGVRMNRFDARIGCADRGNFSKSFRYHRKKD